MISLFISYILVGAGALIIFIPLANMIVNRHLKKKRKSNKKLNTKKAFK